MWLILLKIYLGLLAGVSIIGISRYRTIDTPAKFIVALLTLTAISENTAYYLSVTIQNNLFVYHIFNPIQLVLISIFYNYTITFFKKYNLGILIGILAFVVSILISVFYQNPTTSSNTYFLILESIVVVGMTLGYFYDFLNTTHTTKQFTSPHFWITCILLLFWSFTFFIWLAGRALPTKSIDHILWIKYMMYFINITTYTGFGLVFLFYKKLQPK